ncbi:hypothetical protein [Niabella ginsenosidivorans]|nr:hypothetical protein [Niabella ginsenosidivorans]
MKNEKEQFAIEATVNGKKQQIQVTTAETTDGVDFYVCKVNEKEITQVRKDMEGWKQVWGDLPEDEARHIGSLIDAYLKKNKITS